MRNKGLLLLFGVVVTFALTDAQNVTDICSSVEVRNTLEAFDKLRGCRVVEGFVRIILLDRSEELFGNISFPELTEITDYLLFYRVYGFKALEHLFPNLTVIRGRETFFNYAFVLMGMNQLEEIGLYSLTDIEHGFVRIDRNPSLCYVNTIDWNLIAKEGNHFIRGYKNESECPVVGHRNGRQKICPDYCTKDGRTCNDQGLCCADSCLGGCDLLLNNCKVCKYLTVREGDQRICTTTCPTGFYKLNHQCVTLTQCMNMSRQDKYKIHNGSCLLDCPAKHTPATVNKNGTEYSVCEPCEGLCRKECPETNINSLSALQSLRGCTHIKGSLKILIPECTIAVRQLEENLNMIEVIEGYLKVASSIPLVSLNFFKNLKEIQGRNLENGRFTLVVNGNPNLQELWDRTMKFNNTARFSIQNNPKLCLKSFEFSDVQSNGNKMNCNVTELSVNIINIDKDSVKLFFKQFKTDQEFAYIVYIKEASFRNVTFYGERDACGGDGWRVEKTHAVFHTIIHLKPYTQYAYYVTSVGAQSRISYFRTKAGVPSEPIIKIVRHCSSEIEVTWEAPKQPNGNLTHYIINITCSPINPNEVDNLNNKTCSCKTTDEQLYQFEDDLHNTIYVKRPYLARNKRQIETSANCTSLSYKVRQTNFTLTNLPHFTNYTIQVRACRQRENEEKEDTCSTATAVADRTLNC